MARGNSLLVLGYCWKVYLLWQTLMIFFKSYCIKREKKNENKEREREREEEGEMEKELEKKTNRKRETCFLTRSNRLVRFIRIEDFMYAQYYFDMFFFLFFVFIDF